METRVQRRPLKPSTDHHHSGSRLAGITTRDRGGTDTVWISRNGTRKKLLRDRTRRLLVAPRTARARHRERGCGCGVDRGRPAKEASQDGTDGHGEIGETVNSTLARRARLEHRSRAGCGRRRCATTASRYGRAETRERSLPVADSILIVHAGYRHSRRQKLFRTAGAATLLGWQADTRAAEDPAGWRVSAATDRAIAAEAA